MKNLFLSVVVVLATATCLQAQSGNTSQLPESPQLTISNIDSILSRAYWPARKGINNDHELYITGDSLGKALIRMFGGTTTWGSLTGTLSSQTDLQTELNAKQNILSVTSPITLSGASIGMANQGTTTTVLHGNASGNPSFNAIGLTTDVNGTLPIANGGTGQISSSNAINALLPSQSSNTGKYLTTNGSSASWGTVSGGGGITYSGSVTSGHNNELLYINGSGNLASDPTATFLPGSYINCYVYGSGSSVYQMELSNSISAFGWENGTGLSNRVVAMPSNLILESTDGSSEFQCNWPNSQGSAGQVLTTDGGTPATLSWATSSGGGRAQVPDLNSPYTIPDSRDYVITVNNPFIYDIYITAPASPTAGQDIFIQQYTPGYNTIFTLDGSTPYYTITDGGTCDGTSGWVELRWSDGCPSNWIIVGHSGTAEYINQPDTLFATESYGVSINNSNKNITIVSNTTVGGTNVYEPPTNPFSGQKITFVNDNQTGGTLVTVFDIGIAGDSLVTPFTLNNQGPSMTWQWNGDNGQWILMGRTYSPNNTLGVVGSFDWINLDGTGGGDLIDSTTNLYSYRTPGDGLLHTYELGGYLTSSDCEPGYIEYHYSYVDENNNQVYGYFYSYPSLAHTFTCNGSGLGNLTFPKQEIRIFAGTTIQMYLVNSAQIASNIDMGGTITFLR